MSKLFRDFEEHCAEIDESLRKSSRIILIIGLLAAFGAGIFTGFTICQIIIALK